MSLESAFKVAKNNIIGNTNFFHFVDNGKNLSLFLNSDKQKVFVACMSQSSPFKAHDRARAPPHAPCFFKVRDKHAPSKIFTLLHAPGNKTVCKKEELFCFFMVSYFSIIQLNKVIKVIERSNELIAMFV